MEEIITAWMAYDASQLLPAVDSMIKKLKKYLTLALGKTAPIFAMILDPCIKMDYLQKTLCLHQERNTFGLQYIVNYL
jgi:nucleoid-associated protein YejK